MAMALLLLDIWNSSGGYSEIKNNDRVCVQESRMTDVHFLESRIWLIMLTTTLKTVFTSKS